MSQCKTEKQRCDKEVVQRIYINKKVVHNAVWREGIGGFLIKNNITTVQEIGRFYSVETHKKVTNLFCSRSIYIRRGRENKNKQQIEHGWNSAENSYKMF